ncbi:TIGR02677 family protein [Sorangium sp. So ce887]|uniref:TIGR02677 family protein n=1 Tax=Sorangium sp. So ce887 TaxID=3133324 RepID=UPI003F5EA3C8
MEAFPSRLPVFTYLTVENAALYRAIMRSFVEARERFVLHLRPADVLRAVRENGLDATAVDAALQQLCAWGDLQSHLDTADVATVEEFYRPRFLYQLTPQGEAVERAVSVYVEALAQRGELQAAALGDIRTLLESVAQMLSRPELDDSAVHLALSALRARFDELTSQAQAFMGSLQRSIDLHGAGVASFLAYKQRLIDYLERFVGQLVIATADIAELLGHVDAAAARRLAESAGRREIADALDGEEADLRAAAARWEARIEGLRGWFIGRPGVPSQAEELRARARAAIPALLAAIASLHDRRFTRSDRAADLRTLARWFAEAPTDEDAHRLWRAAFGLASARHLFVDPEALAEREAAPVPASRSWLDAPPLRISPRLRATGRHARPGRPNDVIDRSREKALLLAHEDEEERALAEARARLATGRPARLSELGELTPLAFDMLLDWLGEALAAGGGETTSSDGSIAISLVPTNDGRVATVETPAGTFRGPDHLLTLRALAPEETAPGRHRTRAPEEVAPARHRATAPDEALPARHRATAPPGPAPARAAAERS